jgi:hypothetical protein
VSIEPGSFPTSSRHGPDRHHLRILRTPREVRNALAYTLMNVRKHRAQRPGDA